MDPQELQYFGFWIDEATGETMFCPAAIGHKSDGTEERLFDYTNPMSGTVAQLLSEFPATVAIFNVTDDVKSFSTNEKAKIEKPEVAASIGVVDWENE